MRGWRKEARGLSLDREFQERARRQKAFAATSCEGGMSLGPSSARIKL